jgi:hypothetical protein
MRVLALLLLLACDKAAKPVPALGAGPIPCTVESQVARRKQVAALMTAYKVDAAHELVSRQSCGPDEEMSVELLEELARNDVERAEAFYQVGNFDWCQSSAAPNTMPDGYHSKYFEPSHPVIKAFEQLAKRCGEALAKERALFTPAMHCVGYKPDWSKRPLARAYGIPGDSACLILSCDGSFLLRDEVKTVLTVDKGNLLESSCNNLGRVSFGRGEVLVEAGGRMTDGATWHPYARHRYKLDGTTLTFVRAVRSPADLEAR